MHTNIESIKNLRSNQNAITAPNRPGIGAFVVTMLLAWLALVVYLAGHGGLNTPTGKPPLPILLSVVVPVVVFLAAYRLSQRFHNFVLGFDLRLAAGIQAWRFAGLGFIALFANGVLPGIFAWPAGVGDMIAGMVAPWMMLGLIRSREFVRGKSFLAWNLFGMLDLVTAVSLGGLASMLTNGSGITTRPMAQLPLALIPAYLVPIFFMLHLTALFQRKQLAASSGNFQRAS